MYKIETPAIEIISRRPMTLVIDEEKITISDSKDSWELLVGSRTVREIADGLAELFEAAVALEPTAELAATVLLPGTFIITDRRVISATLSVQEEPVFIIQEEEYFDFFMSAEG